MVEKVEHAHLFVEDLEDALAWYTDVMGLRELTREGDVVYLGCGLNDRYDLAIEGGGTGLDHFAIRVSDEQFERYEQQLADAGAATERHDGTEPGQQRGLRFTLPSGVPMELVTVADDRYQHVVDTATPGRPQTAPTDLDHINVISEDAKADAEFLRDRLDFGISEIQKSDGDWKLVFTRFGDQHHDVAIEEMDVDGFGLHHLAWRMADIGHMKSLIDTLAGDGIRIELGLSRHVSGGNLFTYFWEPGGNRFELSSEMATLHSDTPTVIRESRIIPPTAWGGVEAPESFGEGS